VKIRRFVKKRRRRDRKRRQDWLNAVRSTALAVKKEAR
jgi:hypothetical protein